MAIYHIYYYYMLYVDRVEVVEELGNSLIEKVIKGKGSAQQL